MNITITQEYPAGLDRLWSVFTQPEYPERKYRALGATRFEMLSFHADAQRAEVKLERSTPLAPDKVPELIRKFIKSEQTMRHETHWRRQGGGVDADLHITPVGVPVSIQGKARIQQVSDDLSRMTLNLDVECRIPLIGGKIAKVFAEQIEQALADDYTFTRRYVVEGGA